MRVPRIAHFVYGLRPQTEPFHVVHYLAVESCRQMVEPDEIFFHCKHIPYGVFWDEIRSHVTIVRVDEAPEVKAAAYEEAVVPSEYLYAHHADFIRLDALIEHGGVYADIDVLFLRPLPDEFFDAPFLIGAEEDALDVRSGQRRPSLCNAVLMSEPGARFARVWRDQMGSALDGTWSNHSGFLSRALADELPDDVRVEPPSSFFPTPITPEGLHDLLVVDATDVSRSYTVHLWAHVWWSLARRDFTTVHGGTLTLDHLRTASSSYARLARPFLPDLDLW
jgi:hypothetical protein